MIKNFKKNQYKCGYFSNCLKFIRFTSLILVSVFLVMYIFQVPGNFYKCAAAVYFVLSGAVSFWVYLKGLDLRTNELREWNKYRKGLLLNAVFGVLWVILLLLLILK